MKRYRHILAPAALLPLAVLFFLGLPSIPFHPDETSLLYQSRDLEQYLENPFELALDPAEPMNQENEYRALNAPLVKYVLGIGRRLAGADPASVAVDWNWQASWRENVQSGALPPPEALISGRAASTLMAFLAIPVLAWAGFQLGGWPHALLAGLLYGLNALVLLHGRRAMAEGTLLFTLSLLIASSFVANRRPVLAGLTAGLAISAKHSALPLLVLPIAALIIKAPASQSKSKNWHRWLLTAAGFLLVVVILNPFYWQHPLRAIEKTIQLRASFVNEQLATTEALAPGAVLDSLPERLASFLGNIYFLPSQFQEVGNYQAELATSIQLYQQNPLHRLMIGPIQGGVRLGLTMLGLWGGFRAGLFSSEKRRNLHILAVGTTAMLLATLSLNPLPYQRYYLPLLPLLILWEAIGLITIGHGIKQLVSSSTPGSDRS